MSYVICEECGHHVKKYLVSHHKCMTAQDVKRLVKRKRGSTLESNIKYYDVVVGGKGYGV